METVIKPCAHCQNDFETKKGKFCSNKCKVYYWRAQNPVEKEFCNFCAAPITNKGAYKFCCPEHKKKFFQRKRFNKPVFLKITPKLTIQTNRYDKIQGTIKLHLARLNDYGKD